MKLKLVLLAASISLVACSETQFSTGASTSLSSKNETTGVTTPTISANDGGGVVVGGEVTPVIEVDPLDQFACDTAPVPMPIALAVGVVAGAPGGEVGAPDSSAGSHGKCDHAKGGRGGKVIVCHIPPGNPDAAHEICISRSALPAHLGTRNATHTDTLGSCPELPVEPTL